MHFQLQSLIKIIIHMIQNNIVKILGGAKALVRESKNIMVSRGSKYIEENVLQGNYVSREEHEILKKLVLNLEKRCEQLESKK